MEIYIVDVDAGGEGRSSELDEELEEDMGGGGLHSSPRKPLTISLIVQLSPTGSLSHTCPSTKGTSPSLK